MGISGATVDRSLPVESLGVFRKTLSCVLIILTYINLIPITFFSQLVRARDTVLLYKLVKICYPLRKCIQYVSAVSVIFTVSSAALSFHV